MLKRLFSIALITGIVYMKWCLYSCLVNWLEIHLKCCVNEVVVCKGCINATKVVFNDPDYRQFT